MAFFIFFLSLLMQFGSPLSLEALASQFSASAHGLAYDLQTQEGLNMDCLKVFYFQGRQVGVFHSSKEQQGSGYNAVYSAEWVEGAWQRKSKLSERGSQPTMFAVGGGSSAVLVLYELENHEKGNTIAIRYYDTLGSLFNNSFLYEYQLSQTNDQKHVINIGTPSVDGIELVQAENPRQFSLYKLSIRHHFSPDGKNDYPALGHVSLNPLRDFVDGQKHWVGGCKENYSDWAGATDGEAMAAIRKIGFLGKIGQRDVFELEEGGKTQKYYFY